MINSIIMIHLMICPVTKIVNQTKVWNDVDKRSLLSATKVCRIKYEACLKIFMKVEDQVYRVICKKPQEGL